MEISDLINLYRKQADLTLDQLAERSGVSKGALTKILSGETKAPTLNNMKAIARALGKTLADFDDLPIQKTTSPGQDGPRDADEEDIMKYVEGLTADQQELVLALLQAMIAQNQRKLSSAPGLTGE